MTIRRPGVALLLLAQVGTARAATHQVTPSSDWQTIVSSAATGDVVEFADGTYTAACPDYSYGGSSSQEVSMLIITAGITLRAQNPGQVVLDAQGSSSNFCRVMLIDVWDGAVEVDGFNITGGYANGNGFGDEGAGVYVGGGTVTFNNCNIHGNTAGTSHGAGVYVGGGTVTLNSCNISDNMTGPSQNHAGGGVYVNHGTVTFNNCNIYGNTATGEPGGGFFVNDGTVTLNSCEIHDNTAHGGGGVCIFGGTVTFDSCDIHGNHAVRGDGAGVYVQSGTVTFDSCDIHGNTADDGGGGITALALFTLNATRAYNNTPSDASISVNAPILLLQPVPLGTYLPGAFQCKPVYTSDTDTTLAPPSQQKCNYTLYDQRYMAQLSGTFSSGLPPLCVAGAYGSSTTLQEQIEPLCSGTCPPGHFCPPGSPAPRVCPDGTTSPAGVGDERDCLPCPKGVWCAGGRAHECPAGALGNATGCATPACGGPCPVHHFCSTASVAAIPCPDGTHGATPGLASAAECAPCPAGHWCNSGRAFACSIGFYTRSDQPSNHSVDSSACIQCLPGSTTAVAAAATYASCLCDAHTYLNKSAMCVPCPTGTYCAHKNNTLTTLRVAHGYWRTSELSAEVKPCPNAALCLGGVSQSTRYEATESATCADNLAGVYCMLCRDAYHFFDVGKQRCEPCAHETAMVVLFVVGTAATVAVLALAIRHRQRLGCVAAWHTLMISSRRLSMQAKLKICISYYQIVTQIDRVYAIAFPSSYQKVMRVLNAGFHLLFGWIPGVAAACTGISLEHELLLLCAVPILLTAARIALAAYRRQPLLTALPFTLVMAFLCYPFVASRGFRALATCDCFSYVDGEQVCFLRDAYSIQCTALPSGDGYGAPSAVRAAAWLAVALYACALPLTYAGLLYAARHSLGSGIGGMAPTPLSRGLAFLARDYEPRVFWWELVEVARKLTLTGFLALVEPGTLLQLYLGVAVALCLLILQLYAAPYRSHSDNFLSTCSASALVLTLLGSLGIQMTELGPALTDLGRAQTGLGAGSLSLLVAVLVASAVLVLAVALAMFLHSLAAARVLPVARLAADGAAAVPRILANSATPQWHAFVSHQWSHGQDQARAIKAGLRELVPGLQCFLDVDDLSDLGTLEAAVGGTDCVIVFLSGAIAADGTERSEYMRSANCVRELRAAVESKKRLVFVRETDPQHGAISLDAHMRDCPDDALRAVLDAHMREGRVVPWYRTRRHLQISLHLILEIVLDVELLPSGPPPPRLAAPPDQGAHLHVPPGDAAAADMASLLADEAAAGGGKLVIAGGDDDEPQRRACAFLLHLHRNTFERGGTPLVMAIEAALAVGTPLLLVHEQRSGQQRAACSFGEIISRTPARLRSKGIYNELAAPLYDGAHQRACLADMLHQLAALPAAGVATPPPPQNLIAAAGQLVARGWARLTALGRRLTRGGSKDGTSVRMLDYEMAASQRLQLEAAPSAKV